ncbi:4-hydroxythreonine-4-phosphate dehydrogenase PdxA [Kushneria indalinina]|uniref:4-hydroxythreonine-4-phosphate dehydrogenase n=1 Tax=Kushneria indalinina DSM 14324 TaxID=1122140 RepID=A0A3D9DV19_9GAMM|nr:4-hydroxythreonine-4-phosphate dehydrogenase PdxA [Kushneria indalinina]REC94592.1 4-hydroxythreonine-4-phosphate dehydrogenase [Kushneria indalinina DSM 14324]
MPRSADASNRPRHRTRLLILADDLTGTADSAVTCSSAGLTTQVLLNATAEAPADVIAIDTDSRGCAPAQAARRSRDCLEHWQGRHASLYKKMDSTLRGNVAAELAALIPLAGMAIVAPAFPATGRTTRQGRQYLDDCPVEACEVWTNEGMTGRADLVAMLKQTGLETALLTLDDLHQPPEAVTQRLASWQREGVQAVVCDALTGDDLARIARASVPLSSVFWAGSAGLGEALPEALGLLPATTATGSPATVHPTGPTLIVVGSMSGVSHRQADALQTLAGASLEVVSLEAALLRATVSGNEHDALQRRIEQALRSGRDVLVRLVQGEDRNTQEASQLSDRLGELLSPLLPHASRLIATGGATARAILTAADIVELTLLDAPDIGMARMTGPGPTSLEVITKAGGFGDPDALARLWRAGRSRQTATTLPGTPHMTDRPVIGITMGDAAGVGPEIIVRSLAHDSVHQQCRALVIGDAGRLRDAATRLGSPVTIAAIEEPNQARFEPGVIDCIDLALIPEDLPYGEVSPVAGDAAYQYIARTVTLTQQGQLDAICTAPLNKAALHAGGHIFPGHTELLAHLTGTEEVSMMLVTPKMKVIHVTTHLGIIDAIARIEPGLVQRTIERAHETLARAGIDNPRIAVCGINPHAGENGLFGYGEEEEKIMPAIEVLRARGWNVEGPLPADTLFFRAGRGDFDCVVAMYHDQGHGPVKVMGLEAGVNVTVGLPVVRTSVDHGTAFDIAGRGIADERSMLEALRQAVELASRHDAGAA